jgi:hypothetical protein
MTRPAREARRDAHRSRLAPGTTLDLVLMVLTAASGVVDAVSFLALGKVFTAFMTGNVVFVGLGVAGAFGPSGPDPLRVVAALVAFAAGIVLATRVVRADGGCGMWPRGATGALGAAAVIQVVFEAMWVACAGRPASALTTALAAIAALAMGLQSGAVLSLGREGRLHHRRDRDGDLPHARRGRAADVRRRAGAPGGRAPRARPRRTAGGLLLVHARAHAPALAPLLTLSAVAVAVRALERAPAPPAA